MHTWNVSPKEAIEIQKELRSKINIEPFNKPIKYIAGADVSLNMFSTTAYAGIIVLKYPELIEVEHSVVKTEITFPYIPGLLSFREIPALIEAWEKLKQKPDVIVVDGQGIAHPRRLGIATHFGLVIDMPTIGCAKSILTGIHKDLSVIPGSTTELIDKNTNERIGTLLRSKIRSNPLIISPGNKITQEEADTIIKDTLRGYRLPEPTRQAHELVNAYRRGERK
jgi:deoxyribonuclease V